MFFTNLAFLSKSDRKRRKKDREFILQKKDHRVGKNRLRKRTPDQIKASDRRQDICVAFNKLDPVDQRLKFKKFLTYIRATLGNKKLSKNNFGEINFGEK